MSPLENLKCLALFALTLPVLLVASILLAWSERKTPLDNPNAER